jgi:2-oxoglutarate dehydrogenase E1 component
MQVVVPSTPAQMFHVLRRQVLRAWRKPLVVMTPKSLLRHAKCVSKLDELAGGRFQRLLADPAAPEPEQVARVLLCSGKIFYELDDQRTKLERRDVAIARLEQLYPLQDRDLEAALAPYERAGEFVWVQEEPENAGAWRYLYARLGDRLLGRPFRGISRRASASPATGSLASHRIEQQAILDRAFG